jgi:hypothetical protein
MYYKLRKNAMTGNHAAVWRFRELLVAEKQRAGQIVNSPSSSRPKAVAGHGK